MSQCSLDDFSRAILSQRIVYVDSYTSFPIPEVDVLFSQFKGSEVKRVPVIRIYGATTQGQKACAHIHGVFPYLYVEFNPGIHNLEQRLAVDLDREINIALSEFSIAQSEHVYKIIQVTGRSFYGYKQKSQTFLKIYFYSPIALTKAINILQSGKICSQRFQPYEAHIPYILQFFLDFKLHGMNFIHFSNVKFRSCDNKRHDSFHSLEHGVRVDLNQLHSRHFLSSKVLRKSRCELEFDVSVTDIIQSQATGKNPGIEAIWLDEKERRRQNGLANWGDVTIPVSQPRPFDSFVFTREAELLETLSTNLRSNKEAEPVNEERSVTPPLSFTLPEVLTPSSQVLIEDVTYINACSLAAISQSLDWNEEDEEMVSLLEDMARNRATEEEDSIISSQVLEDFDNDPTLLVSTNGVGEGDRDDDHGSTVTPTLDDDNCDGDDDVWGQDFLSSQMIQFLDKCEEEARTPSKTVEESVTKTVDNLKTKKDSKVKPFNLNQADGQFDSSEDDDNEDAFVIARPSFPRLQHRALPISGSGSATSRRMKSAEDLLRKPKAFPRCSSTPALVSPRSRFRAKTPPSPPIISSSDDDEALTTKQKLSVPEIAAQSTINVSNFQRHVSPSKIAVSPRRSYITPPRRLQSPPIISSSSDSEETNFVPSDTDVALRTVCTPSSGHGSQTVSERQEEESASSVKGEESAHRRAANSSQGNDIECASPASSQDPCGIRSFYLYPGDNLTQIPSDSDATQLPAEASESAIEVPEVQSPLSQDQSISSFYDYSEPEHLDSDEALNTSFHGVCMSQFLSSSDFESSDSGSDGEKNNFPRRALKLKLKLKEERECVLEEKDKYCPSLFEDEIEILPLKNPPACFDLETEDAGSDDAEKAEDFLPPPNTSRVETKALRTKIVQDILTFTKTVERHLETTDAGGSDSPPAILIPKARPNFSDSDSEESVKEARAFRFGGNASDGEDALSSDISDNESEVELTPKPRSEVNLTPLTLNDHGARARCKSKLGTPKSGGWVARKRRRLNWGSQEERTNQSQGIPLSLEQSELDSISFTSSQSPGGMLNSSNFQDVKALQEKQFLRTLSLEVHCSARGSLTPDPKEDSIQAIFYFMHDEALESNSQINEFRCLMVNGSSSNTQLPGSVTTFENELTMIRAFVQLVHEMDPDIFVGYEICKFSWGYLIDRGRVLGMDLTSDLSKLLPLNYSTTSKGRDPRNQQQWNESISGRIVLNLWRLLRHEMTVTSYTFENAVFQILHERVHLLSYRILADQWETLNQKFKVISYFKRRVLDVIRIIEKLDIINRTSELARLFGIQFFEVLSRGSQFRVESMMLRLAKAENFIPPSPSPMQRAKMKAPEYLPLIMEPESKFYKDPVAVLDFQSLYPSMMMAYNYCFSTCIGRVKSIGLESTFDFGCLSQCIQAEEVESLISEGLIHVSPCGVAFVKESVRKGILGEMLEQILDTRQMVKRSMKKWKTDVTLQKVLDSRQLGLKLIANVTYGYTSANYSGRMPCVEIADSVVSKGRETLQRAIDFVKENEQRFGGKVVYGDTDSLFIHFPGKSRSEAFKISQTIVDEITALNPKPVKLKLEKVYQPCILQTKKRYVGHAYETPDQSEPTYDAKGIETVRRDGCPATGQILKGALKILFVTQDEASVKAFVQEQFRKLFMGRVSLSKYTFAREYRGRGGYKPTAVVPSLEIARRLVEKDPRAEPLTSQRVPYIVVYGDPNLPLIQLIRRPQDFIGNHNLRLNAHYYVEKAIIPALNRCFSLAKMDVSKWYDEMPRKYLKSHYGDGGAKRGTIDQYFVSESCVKCESRTKTGFCDACFDNVAEVKEYLNEEEGRLCRKFETCCNICVECSGEEGGVCINMDCPVKHRFLRYELDYKTKLPKLESLHQKISLAMTSW